MTAKTQILETLNELSFKQLDEFKSLVEREKGFPLMSRSRLKEGKTQDVAELMVETFGQDCVDVTKKVLKEMKRTDLVRRLSEVSSGTKKKVSADEHRSALIQKAAAVAAVKHLLLEILNYLSDEEVKEFNSVLQWTDSKWNAVEAQRSKTVHLMLETYSQQSVEVTKKVLKNMNRTDLVQRLSETSPGTTEKHSVDEQLPTLIQREETMASVIELLLETLSDLRDEEIKDFRKNLLRQIHYDKRYSYFTWSLLKMDLQDTVFLMVQIYGQQSVETTKSILKKMYRTDLVQRLSDSSSGPTKKPSVDEHLSALIHKVAAMAAVKELLLETLTDLRHGDVEKFKLFLQLTCFQRGLPYIPWRRPKDADRAQTVVNLMVETCGQQSVEVIMEVLMDMNKTDLVQRLSETSSGFKASGSSAEVSGVRTTEGVKHERCSALIQKEETMASVIELLLETLSDLRNEEIKDFRKKLQRQIHNDRTYSDFTWSLLKMDLQDTVFLMVQTYGQQSVETTKRILEKMYRTDLVQRLSDSSSGPTKKVSADKRRSALIQKVAAVAAVKHLLVETLNDLSNKEFEEFNKDLKWTDSKWNTLDIRWMFGHKADRSNTVDLMLETYGEQSVEVTKKNLKNMNRTDLVQKLSETSSGPKGPSRSLEFEACGSTLQESSNWTKLEPEVNSTDADEAPTYSLQSEAGNFECSVSDLRWVCKEKVSFKYQFCSWEGHMERMESKQYMPAGPLMDITVTAGRLDEVYLPHWICIDDNQEISEKFAVLHIDDCGDVVEKVSEITSSHIKLREPVFSPRAALMKIGFPVKIRCYVLIYYKPNTPFLKLHVYLIPKDPALEKAVKTVEFEDGYNKIKKSHPNKYLKMQNGFILTADIDTATIIPQKLTLRYDCQDPNFYEVFIECPDRDFHLKLSDCRTKTDEPVWTCKIRRDDYSNSGHVEAAGSSGGAASVNTLAQSSSTVDENLPELIQKATITPVRMKLLKTLECLKKEDLKKFKWYLQDSIPTDKLEQADMCDLVNLMTETYPQQYVEVAKRIFEGINRNDLVQTLPERSSGSKASGSSA